jgi:flagellar export protein FliJ
MKKFKFKFEPILVLRKNMEELILRELAAAQLVYRNEVDAKINLEKQLEDSLQRREKLGQQPTGIEPFHIEQNFIMGTKQRIVMAKQSILRASKRVEKVMKRYLEARKKTQQMEKLKERYFDQFKADRRDYENKQLDDLMIMRNDISRREL